MAHETHISPGTVNFTAPARLGGLRQRSLLVGLAAALACVVAAFLDWPIFLRTYLVGYMFVLGLSLGSLSLLMLQHLSGGQWGAVMRRPLEAASALILPLAILFLPIALGIPALYHWADPASHGDAVIDLKRVYLNVPFFLLRSAIYFAIWIFWSWKLIAWSEAQDRDPMAMLRGPVQNFSAFGILIYVLSMTFASIDWVMSTNAHWFSTIYGLLFVGGNALSALAFCIAALAMLRRSEPMSLVLRARHFHDLGALMMAFVMLWAYFNLSQWLIIWSGNLPEEIPWYLARMQDGWQYVTPALFLFHFVLPFCLLLSRDLKRSSWPLAMLAGLVVVTRLLDIIWHVAPNFTHLGEEAQQATHAGEAHAAQFAFIEPVFYAVTPLALFALWFAFFLAQLAKRPLMPINDPRLADTMEPDHGH